MKRWSCLLTLVLAEACATPRAAPAMDPAVRSLRLVVAPAVTVNAPGLEDSGQELRAALERALRQQGFRPVDVQGPDGTLRLSLAVREPGGGGAGSVRAKLSLLARSGEDVDEREVERPGAFPATQREIDGLAVELLDKLERAASVEVLARTGVTGILP